MSAELRSIKEAGASETWDLPFSEFPFTDMCSPLTHLVPVDTEMIFILVISGSVVITIPAKTFLRECWVCPSIRTENLSKINLPIRSATDWGKENSDLGTDVPVEKEKNRSSTDPLQHQQHKWKNKVFGSNSFQLSTLLGAMRRLNIKILVIFVLLFYHFLKQLCNSLAASKLEILKGEDREMAWEEEYFQNRHAHLVSYFFLIKRD